MKRNRDGGTVFDLKRRLRISNYKVTVHTVAACGCPPSAYLNRYKHRQVPVTAVRVAACSPPPASRNWAEKTSFQRVADDGTSNVFASDVIYGSARTQKRSPEKKQKYGPGTCCGGGGGGGDIGIYKRSCSEVTALLPIIVAKLEEVVNLNNFGGLKLSCGYQLGRYRTMITIQCSEGRSMGSTEISTIGQGSRQTIITLHLPPQDRNVVSCGVYGTTGTKIAHVEVHYRTGKVHGLFMGHVHTEPNVYLWDDNQNGGRSTRKESNCAAFIYTWIFVNIATTIKQSIAKRPQDVLHSAPRSWLHHRKIRIPVPKSRHLIKNARVVVDATVGTALMVVRVNRQTEPSILMLLGGTAPPPSNNRQGLKEWYAEEVTQRRHNVHTPKKCSTYYIHTHQVLP
ncbi:hypothetical protein GEV33_004675 [Tenebrio molitor]|uniref:Uncharacterized protein n=1 Tax=Tenebrio molitor TaxID=7067 RepID=A0A8J6HMT3_TENMO|nr:hypothetical protein GEV33_004675 [Tenebrio molitor]